MKIFSMRYTYNHELFSQLAKILGVRRRSVGESIGHSRMWYTHAINSGDVIIRHLLTLCNHYQIDIRAFILKEGDPIVPTPLVIEDDWKPIGYYPELLMSLWQNRKDVIVQRKQILHDTGWDKTTLRSFMQKESSPMKMLDWVQLVNLYELDPMMIFGNLNQWVNNKTIQQKDKEIESLKRQLLKARLEASTLRSRLAHREKIDDLKNI